MQILPSEALLPFIKHYLFLENKKSDITKLRLFSDGNTGIVFSFKKQLIASFKKFAVPDCLPDTFLYGQINKFNDIYSPGEINLLIAVFHPAGMNELLGIPAEKLRNKIIRIEEIFGSKGTELQEKLIEQPGIQDKIGLLNNFFLQLVAKNTIKNQLIVTAALDFIVKNKGQVSLDRLVKFTGYSERQIERKFLECIGLNPKKFADIVKLHVFLKQLKDKTAHINLTDVAYDAGYFDQSHSIKVFRKNTGFTPQEYLHNTETLSNNFVIIRPFPQ